ncbi:MAG TPA: hypothetical protein PKJ97_04140, partial [Candidatus Bilamarchaeaceae archaeon]|nr:hypothetical protein [Candidatus Bilamarchaeaceae archaeon]
DIGQAASPAFITINNSACGTIGVLRETGFPTSLASILTNGLHYPTSVTCNGELATFYVDGFSGYTLGQEATTLDFNINESSPITYGTSINITCNASNTEVLVEIFQNGTSIAGPLAGYVDYAGVFAAGLYNFSCNTSGNENYTAAEASEPFQINKASPAVTFVSDLGWSIRPGQTVNISCNTSNPEITIELWNSTEMIGSGQYAEHVWTPPAGSYEYTCNSTETENYTAYIQTSTLNVRTPSSGGGRETVEPQLSISAPDEAPQGSIMSITVEKEGGVTVPLVRVVVGQGSSVLLDEYTDAWGRVFFTPLSTGTYAITASRTGFLTATDSFSVFPAMGCGVDGDCAYNEACIAG